MKKVICIMGPTAAGKTALACEIFSQLPVELISVDSAMIYRGMDIGTAKPSPEELMLFPHALIDILDPPQSFSAADFCQHTQKLCQHIFSAKKTPLLVGGTMMYFHALQQGMSALPSADQALRQKISDQAQQQGWQGMHDLLNQVDPDSAARFHPHDTQRIQRALEIYYLSGQPMSTFLAEKKPLLDVEFINILLLPHHRSWLHERIAQRFTHMLNHRFLEEVRALVDNWQLTLAYPAMRCVGYRQALEYLQGLSTYEEFCAKALAATRQLAKRQLTWLRQWPSGISFACEDEANRSSILDEVRSAVESNQIIFEG